MGTYTANADGLLTEWEAAGKWNHMIVSGDSFGVVDLATLTIDASRGFLLGQAGANGDGSDPGAGNRCGHITVAAGLTLTFDGNANRTLSGLTSNVTAGTETKDCTLTINGTSANHVVFTNSNGAPSTSYQWMVNWVYGKFGDVTYLDMKFCNIDNAVQVFTIPCADSYSTATLHILEGPFTYFVGSGFYNGRAVILFSPGYSAAGMHIDTDIGFCYYDCTDITGSVYCYGFQESQNYSNTADVTIKGVATINVSGGKRGLIIPMAKSSTLPIQTSSFRAGEDISLATETVPTDLTLTSLGDGTVKVTVSNFATGTYLIVYDGAGNVRGAIGYADYVTAVDRKPANCLIIGGVPLSEISTWTAKFTSDLFVFSAACAAAAAVTPTFLPVASDVTELVDYGQGSGEFTGTRPSGSKTISFGI